MTATFPLAQMTRDFLDAILPTVRDGYLIVAVGSGPHYNGNGKYSHSGWLEKPFHWPSMADAAVAFIQQHAQTCDVWICPYLMKTAQRHKGNAAYRALVHCDVDGGLDMAKVRAIGPDAFAIGSGTAGHGHVYVTLDYPVTPVQHDLLERGLVAHLGGDPGKISENDLLRPPGTWNHKAPGMTFVTPL
jgi:hypothetical protein